MPNLLSGLLAQAQPTAPGHRRGAQVMVVERGAESKYEVLVGYLAPWRKSVHIPFSSSSHYQLEEHIACPEDALIGEK